MGYRLQLSAEMYDWLAELRDADPTAADPTAQALAALALEGDRLGRSAVPLGIIASRTRATGADAGGNRKDGRMG